MIVKYGKVNQNLFTITGAVDLEENSGLPIERQYEIVWRIDPNDLEHVMRMLVEAGIMGVDYWRVKQIKVFYDIRDDEIIKFAKEMLNIHTTVETNGFTLKARKPGTTQVIVAKGADLIFGIIHVMVSAGYRIRPPDPDTKSKR